MAQDIEIIVGDVTDMEARVCARFSGDKSVSIRGKVRGPFCENAHTLPADFPFRTLSAQRPGEAEAIVTDPCLWSPEMPHVYQVDVEARQDDRIVAEYHRTIGLR